MILVLMLVFLAFQVPFTFGILVAGFSMAYLFLIMSPTPSGIGIVEGVLTISLHSMGVPLDDAAVITLVYRGSPFWVPFLFGLSTFRYLTTQSENLQGGNRLNQFGCFQDINRDTEISD